MSATAVPATEPVFHSAAGFDIPVRLIYMTGGGPEQFEAETEFHMNSLKAHVPVEPDHSVLEIGCGVGRDAMPLTKVIDARGSYLGVDIILNSIEWCRDNITSKFPNFTFMHYDVSDALHNPTGSTRTSEITIPLADNSVDRVVLWSVFTHMASADIIHYLKEFSRVMKPGGLVFATWFIVNDDILRKARETNLTPFNLRFEHDFEPGCLINDANAPMGAVAYTDERLREMIAEAGLELVNDVLPGMWSGFHAVPKGGQDATVLRKPFAS